MLHGEAGILSPCFQDQLGEWSVLGNFLKCRSHMERQAKKENGFTGMLLTSYGAMHTDEQAHTYQSHSNATQTGIERERLFRPSSVDWRNVPTGLG